MAVRDKSKLKISIPSANPDKIVGRLKGSFVTTTNASTGWGASYDGTYTYPNPVGKRALPISRYSIDNVNFYTDFEQNVRVVVVGACTDTQVKYRWASNDGAIRVYYETILISMDN